MVVYLVPLEDFTANETAGANRRISEAVVH
jgi:hypothetical protein